MSFLRLRFEPSPATDDTFTMPPTHIVQSAVVGALCSVMILTRTFYRIFFRCTIHQRCPRKWHADDVWMTFALLPLIGRAITITWSWSLLSFPPDATDEYIHNAEELSSKLLMPGRIFYLTFLWCCKFCLLELYLRLSSGIPVYRRIGEVIRWSLYVTWVAVVLATLLECRPIVIAWNDDPAGDYCRKARANLITMASCNIATDLALILFPLFIIKRTGLDFYRLVRLSILFALGSLVIITTIIRVPLILRDDAQKTRSLWASIELSIACFIAQAPFYQAVYVDRRLGQHSALSKNESLGTNIAGTRSQVTTYHERSRSSAAKRRERDQEDEIGLWTIEKRVSFSVSGRRTGESDDLERHGTGSESSRKGVEHIENVSVTDVVAGGSPRSGRQTPTSGQEEVRDNTSWVRF